MTGLRLDSIVRRWRELARRQALPCAAVLLLVALVAVSVASPHLFRPAMQMGLSLLAVAVAMGCLARAVRADRRINVLASRAAGVTKIRDDASSWDPLTRLERGLRVIELQHGSMQHRLALRHLSSGLPTREPLFAKIEREAGSGGVLGVINLTDFDQLSAFDPDQARRLLAAITERTVRMLGDRHFIAHVDRSRLGIWYGSDTLADTACAELEALGYALGSAIEDGDRELVPNIRVGYARAPQDGTAPELLLARAIAGFSQLGIDSSVDPLERARQRYGMEQDLRRAIERDEFVLHFQPLIDADAGRVCGAEALLRWRHPVQGLVSPSHFIPIVEEAGLTDEVGLWVLNAACREARRWQRRGLPTLRMAVNLSGQQLDRPDLDRLIERTLARHSLSPAALEVELTETVATRDADHVGLLFNRLRALGIAIAIDDFGTGYSSFSALRGIAFDKIKIDREFVTGVHERSDSQAICRSVLALGEGLGIRVLAEGVERPEEYQWLRRARCAHFQGFYFSPPLESAAFQAFVRDGDRLAHQLAVSLPERRTA